MGSPSYRLSKKLEQLCHYPTPKDSALVQREIQELREALEAFKAAVEAGEVTGYKDGSLKAHGG
jgi:hypothetical protein